MKIKWLSDAVDDLIAISGYIANDNPNAARNVAERIKDSVNSLSEHQGIGRAGRVEGTRELVVSGLPYIIPYRVKNNVVEILRVLHGARTWPEEL
ncbi:MAG: type II toxin-antitoxin system RelE/ParE family toxin [Nitrospirae bacterium]|nr:type II toxin-antitoxin system RelE/ParE family toxin [Nitrospirota bacterium]